MGIEELRRETAQYKARKQKEEVAKLQDIANEVFEEIDQAITECYEMAMTMVRIASIRKTATPVAMFFVQATIMMIEMRNEEQQNLESLQIPYSLIPRNLGSISS